MAKDLNLWPNKSRTHIKQKRIAESEFNWRKGNMFFHCFTVNGQRYTASDKSPQTAKELAAKKAGIEYKTEKPALV